MRFECSHSHRIILCQQRQSHACGPWLLLSNLLARRAQLRLSRSYSSGLAGDVSCRPWSHREHHLLHAGCSRHLHVPGGPLEERYGTRRMITVRVVLCGLCVVLVAYAKSVVVIYAWAFLTDLSTCFVYIPRLPLFRGGFPREKGWSRASSAWFSVSRLLSCLPFRKDADDFRI